MKIEWPSVLSVALGFGIWELLILGFRRRWHSIYAFFTGKNAAGTPVDVIVDQLNEPRPLPLGRRDFSEWAHRIITGAMLPVVEGEDAIAFIESQKFALATMIMHLGPTESHKPDAFFIHQLRKSASNQVAHEILQELKKARMEKAKKEEDARLAGREQHNPGVGAHVVPVSGEVHQAPPEDQAAVPA